jgi:hypothetical protein
MMRPEISAKVTRFIGFASGNGAAVPLLESAIRNNVIVYPVNRTKQIPRWLHLHWWISAAIVVGAVTFMSFVISQ